MPTPLLFFFADQLYSYPTLDLAQFDGRCTKVDHVFLEGGTTISGEFRLRIIVSPAYGAVNLIDQTPGHDPVWIKLTRPEAELVISRVVDRAAGHSP